MSVCRALQLQAFLRARRGRRPLRKLGTRRPAPAHPRPGLARPAVIQRRHVRPAAPSRLPPPSPRAWQEKRATWSGNKGPRGPRQSGTRCHSTSDSGHRCGLGPTPRPHAPGSGRSHGGEPRRGQTDPRTRRWFLTAGTEIPAFSLRQVIAAPTTASEQAHLGPPALLALSAPALPEAAGTARGRQCDPAT